MRTRPLGRTGLQLTELCFGAAPIGNLYRATGEQEARDAVDAAWERGVRYFDTAPHYGLGLSERRLGKALAARPRDDYVVSTKVGRLLVPDPAGAGRRDDDGFDVPADVRRVWDFSGDGVRRSLESSLERLGLDRVDIVYLHDPDDHWQPALREAYPALEQLRAQGVVRAIGAGMNQSAMLARFLRETDMDLVMVAGRYTLLDREAEEELLPLALEKGVGVVAAAPFNSGLLARRTPPQTAKFDYVDAPREVLDRARRLAVECESAGTELPTAALQFALQHPAVVSVAIGMRTADQVRQNADRYQQPVPPSLWDRIDPSGRQEMQGDAQ